MATTMLVTGMVKTGADADAAVEQLIDRGYPREDINLVMSEKTLERHFSLESGSQVAAGAGIGGAVGGALCAIIAAVAAVGTSVVLPGLSLVVAGPVAAALAGAGAGSATGGAIGALIGAGIPAYRAHLYESDMGRGAILIGVQARSAAEVREIERVFRAFGAAQVRVAPTEHRLVESYA